MHAPGVVHPGTSIDVTVFTPHTNEFAKSIPLKSAVRHVSSTVRTNPAVVHWAVNRLAPFEQVTTAYAENIDNIYIFV